MLNRNLIGSALTPFCVELEHSQLRAFATATAQGDPVYSSEPAARAAGYPGLLVPPTFLFCLEMAGPNPMEVYERLGVDYAHVLHGEQHFTYHRLVFAGELLRFSPRIADIYERAGGNLGFIVWETHVTGVDGDAVADLRSVMVVRQLPNTAMSKPKHKALGFDSKDFLSLVEGPITQHTLGVYAGASGDYNPLHINIDYAKQAGLPDVIAHGMLSAAYVARLLTQNFGQAAIHSLSLRFVAITHIGDEVHCSAKQGIPETRDGHLLASVELAAHDQYDECKLCGTANIRVT